MSVKSKPWIARGKKGTLRARKRRAKLSAKSAFWLANTHVGRAHGTTTRRLVELDEWRRRRSSWQHSCSRTPKCHGASRALLATRIAGRSGRRRTGGAAAHQSWESCRRGWTSGVGVLSERRRDRDSTEPRPKQLLRACVHYLVQWV